MLATINTYPFFKQLIEDWDVFIILLEKGSLRKTPLSKKEKQVWETIDKSLPIVVENRLTRLKLEEPQIWFVRVIMHKVKGKCIDIRQFNRVENEYTVYYQPTETGLTLSLEEWLRIIDPFFKMLRKHNDNK